MTLADLPEGMRLKAEAGWNQVEADWRRFLDMADGGAFVAEREGRVVGSVTSRLFGPVGWVAMLLVERARRGEGIGRRLLMRSLEHMKFQGAESFRLDATAAGRPLYESLGFRVDFPLARYRGVLRNAGGDETTRAVGPEEAEAVAALDRTVTGTDRRVLIKRLLHDNPDDCLVAGSVQGFVCWRPGSGADQVGPCIAGPECGGGLLDGVSRRLAGREVIVDVLTAHREAVNWAEGSGLRPSREFWRMTRGEAVVEDQSRLWASSGPEMG